MDNIKKTIGKLILMLLAMGIPSFFLAMLFSVIPHFPHGLIIPLMCAVFSGCFGLRIILHNTSGELSSKIRILIFCVLAIVGYVFFFINVFLGLLLLHVLNIYRG